MTSLLLKLFLSPKQPGLPRQVRGKVDLQVEVEVEAERTHKCDTPIQTRQRQREENPARVVLSLAGEHTLLGIKQSPGGVLLLTPPQCTR